MKLIPILSGKPVNDPRFQVVSCLLKLEAIKDRKIVTKLFFERGIDPESKDYQIVWRSLVVGHRSEPTRNFAATQLDIQYIWQLIARNNLSLKALYALGLILKTEPDDRKKIFFDSIRGRLQREALNVTTRETAYDLARLITLLLGFEFLVETKYFDRFDEILRLFQDGLTRLALGKGIFEKKRLNLWDIREKRRRPPGSLPDDIDDKPLPIQRRLAGEKIYLNWAIQHEDSRIAMEAFQNIDINNIQEVLANRNVNSSLFKLILKRTDLFGRKEAITAALMHPMCTKEFADVYIPRTSRNLSGKQYLEQLRCEPEISRIVRRIVECELARRI